MDALDQRLPPKGAGPLPRNSNSQDQKAPCGSRHNRACGGVFFSVWQGHRDTPDGYIRIRTVRGKAGSRGNPPELRSFRAAAVGAESPSGIPALPPGRGQIPPGDPSTKETRRSPGPALRAGPDIRDPRRRGAGESAGKEERTACQMGRQIGGPGVEWMRRVLKMHGRWPC